jgi:sugar-phosphatase
MIKAVIFDMDGLLVDSEPFWRKAEIEAFSEVGIFLTENDCRETMGYRLNEVLDLWYSRTPWIGKSKKDVEDRILSLVSHYILTEAEPLPGVHKAIEICRQAGLKTAIASSSPILLINSVVKKFALQHKFVLLHSAEFEAFGKPHPAVFIHTARELEVAPYDCIVLEDSFHGMIAGLAARMRTIVVPAKDELDHPKWAPAFAVLQSLDNFENEWFN